jgi:glycosyltransferase involved in cell wall biosynthesis
VHDWLNQIGGAENVLTELLSLFPSSPLFTAMYWSERMPAFYRQRDIRTSFMNRLPGIMTHHQWYLPLYPMAFEGFDLRGYDVVISNKSGFCHGVVLPPGTRHFCYCLTPTRYLWNYHDYVQREEIGGLARRLLPLLLPFLRQWDFAAAQRVDHFAVISTAVQQRVAQYYRRDSVIIFPPVETDRFVPQESVDDYFLIVSRLIPYKRIDLAIEACNQLGRPLWIAGDGRDRPRLERLAGDNVRFLGRVPDDELPELYARCRAFIFPGEEDFGIAPVEAQAAGRPVVAYAVGGAVDTVVDGQTGALFSRPTADSLAGALQKLDDLSFDPPSIRQHARQFDRRLFRRNLMAWIESHL